MDWSGSSVWGINRFYQMLRCAIICVVIIVDTPVQSVEWFILSHLVIETLRVPSLTGHLTRVYVLFQRVGL